MLQIISVVALVLFFLLLLAVGLYSSKKNNSVQDYLLGGRNIGAWMSAFSYGTSYFSAVIFIGYAGKTGWGVGIGGIWIGIGNALLGSLLAWKLLARRTREMTHRLGSSTMPEFFEARFGSKNMKIFSSLMIFVFLIPYAASVYMGLGYLFSSVFPGANEVYAMLIIAVCTFAYLVLGGYIAVSITDFIQGIVMLIGVGLMIFCVLRYDAVGGLMEGLRKLSLLTETSAGGLVLPVGKDLSNLFGGANWFTLLSMVLLTSFGTWGLPQMVHKFYAIKDTQAIKKATVISTIFAAIIGTGAYLVGAFGRLVLDNTLPQGGFDNVVPEMLRLTLSGNLWTNLVFAMILLLVLSASMSTLASVILASSSAVTVDLIKGVIRPSLDKKKEMALMRVFCAVFIALSFGVASLKVGFIVALMSFSWGVLSGSFLGPYLWGLYSKKTTKAGAWSGMVGGFATVLLLVLWTTFTGETLSAGFDAAKALSPTFGVLGMLVSVIIVPIVSRFTRPLDAPMVENAFAPLSE